MKSGFSRARRGFVVSLFAASALAVSAAAGSGRVWHQLGVRDRAPWMDADNRLSSTNLTVLLGQMATLTSVSWGGQSQPAIEARLDIAGVTNTVELTPGSQVIGPAVVTLSLGPGWWDGSRTFRYSPAIAIIATEPVEIGAQVVVESSADLRVWAPAGDALLPADPGTNAFYRVKLNPVSQSR